MVLQKLLDPFRSTDNDVDGLSVLQDLLAERGANLTLRAVYDRPTVNTQGEVTAVFPMTLYYDGEKYGVHKKEFFLPDGGLSNEDAPLTMFLSTHDIESVENLGDIEGNEAEAVFKNNGEVEVLV